MDYQFRTPYLRNNYLSVEGTIVDIQPMRIGNRRANGCMTFVSVEDVDGNLVNFIVTPTTFVLDFVTLREGMECTFFYRADAPAPLIYPPQYNAVVAALNKNGQFVAVGHFNGSLINEDRTLQLNMDNRVQVVTTNNQTFMGSPADRDLVVVYDITTRSIPAQTTPLQVVVLCETM